MNWPTKAAREYMDIFIDESIHDRGNFIVIAAVFSIDDLQELVGRALRECGFDPARDEYKSSMKMAGTLPRSVFATISRTSSGSARSQSLSAPSRNALPS